MESGEQGQRQPDGVVRLERSQADRAIETLIRAFRDTLPLSYYFPDDTERGGIAPLLMAMAVYPSFKYGEVHASSSAVEGIAVWVPSENYPISPWRLLRTVPLSVLFAFGGKGGYKLKGLGQYIDDLHARLAPFEHMYLQSLGVEPASQGTGAGGRLLRHMHARMDAEGRPTYLETIDPKNVGFYEHLGYKIIDESTVPGTELTNWAMLRRP